MFNLKPPKSLLRIFNLQFRHSKAILPYRVFSCSCVLTVMNGLERKETKDTDVSKMYMKIVAKTKGCLELKSDYKILT